jgi:hypothetical protein
MVIGADADTFSNDVEPPNLLNDVHNNDSFSSTSVTAHDVDASDSGNVVEVDCTHVLLCTEGVDSTMTMISQRCM